jgi:hypothetical protein
MDRAVLVKVGVPPASEPPAEIVQQIAALLAQALVKDYRQYAGSFDKKHIDNETQSEASNPDDITPRRPNSRPEVAKIVKSEVQDT